MELVQCADTLYHVKNVLTNQALAYLESHYYYPYTWQFDATSGRRMVYHLNKNFDDDLVMTFTQELQQFLLERFSQKFQIQETKLFFDTRGHHTSCHADNSGIALMMQIYLQSECIGAPGTSFHLERIYNITNIRNHGYMNFNSDGKLHESFVLPDGVRRSFAISMSLVS